MKVKFTVEKENEVETNWSETSTLEVSQKVSYEFELFGGLTTFTFSQDWQKGGSRRKRSSWGWSPRSSRN